MPGWEAKQVRVETVKDEEGVIHYVYLYIR
jgi:hypothetical protein